MKPLAAILRAVGGGPKTVTELSRELGSTPEAVTGMLVTLQAGGYVQEAVAGEGACACTGCSLKSLCRNADDAAPQLHLLRLTPRGAGYLSRVE